MRGRLLPLSFYYFTIFGSLGVYAPFFPRWLEGRGVQGLRMGAVAALLPAMGVIGPPLVGLAADALGLRGQILRLASFGSAVAFATVAAAGAFGPRAPRPPRGCFAAVPGLRDVPICPW